MSEKIYLARESAVCQVERLHQCETLRGDAGRAGNKVRHGFDLLDSQQS